MHKLQTSVNPIKQCYEERSLLFFSRIGLNSPNYRLPFQAVYTMRCPIFAGRKETSVDFQICGSVRSHRVYGLLDYLAKGSRTVAAMARVSFCDRIDVGFSWILHGVNTSLDLFWIISFCSYWTCFSVSYAFLSEYLHSKGCKRLSAPAHAQKQIYMCTHKDTRILFVPTKVVSFREAKLTAWTACLQWPWCSTEDGKRFMHWPSGF